MTRAIAIVAALIIGHAYLSARRDYAIGVPTVLTDTAVVAPIDPAHRLRAVEARLAVADPGRLHEGDSPAYATLTADKYSLVIRRHSAVNDNVYDGAAIRLSLFLNDSLAAMAECPDLAKRPGTQASYALEMCGDTLTVLAGTGNLKRRMAVKADSDCLRGKVSLAATGTAEVTIFVTEEHPVNREEKLAGLPPSEVDRRLSQSKSDIVGTYSYLDRSTDPSVARPGGRYRLAIVPDNSADSTFLVIYMAGAEVEPGLWRPGMLKGVLTPTSFEGQYELAWYDAHGSLLPADSEAYAVYDKQAGILTLNFPLLSQASLRFARQ